MAPTRLGKATHSADLGVNALQIETWKARTHTHTPLEQAGSKRSRHTQPWRGILTTLVHSSNPQILGMETFGVLLPICNLHRRTPTNARMRAEQNGRRLPGAVAPRHVTGQSVAHFQFAGCECPADEACNAAPPLQETPRRPLGTQSLPQGPGPPKQFATVQGSILQPRQPSSKHSYQAVENSSGVDNKLAAARIPFV